MLKTLAASLLLALPSIAAAKRPHFASIGDLQIDRRAWTVKGSNASVAIDNEARSINGTANGKCVRLKFEYSVERIRYDGAPECGGMRYVADFVKGTVVGQYNGKHLDARFDQRSQPQTMTGSYGGQPIELTLTSSQEQPGSGTLTGRINGQSVSLRVVNAGIEDFAEHLYLILKP